MRCGKITILVFSLILLAVTTVEGSQLGKDIWSGITSAFGPSVEERIALTVKDVNKSLPKMIPGHMRLDQLVAGPGKQLTYNYTVLQEDTVQRIKANLPGLRKKVCTTKGTVFYLSKGVTLVYVYHRQSGAEFAHLTVKPTDCR